MSSRKAFLIGAEEYGEGFVSLPAVRQDIQLMSSSLEACGYEVEICPPEVLTNASVLDSVIRSFCSDGGSEDIRILYFTGHGLLLDNVDCIIPAGTSRKDALTSRNQRVSTDLSQTVADSSIGLVLFIIDACRDKADIPVTKGGAEWGDQSRLMRPEEARFIRYFGCASNEICQVLLTISEEQASSLFTKVLVDCLDNGNCFSLIQFMYCVEKFCLKVLSEHSYLQNQKPRLSYGELSAEKQDVLKRPIFGTDGNVRGFSVWPLFDPNKLHCLVVISETDPQFSPDWGLKELVDEALVGSTGERIWDAFILAFNHQKLVSGQERILPNTFESSVVSFGVFSVTNAYTNHERLDQAIRAVVEADLVIFDVTGFEPGVMLLIGIRSACRRSLSICSYGGGWHEGQPLEIPFNLQELNINSHAPEETLVDENSVVARFVRRVETGFHQLSRHPRYLDLPAFDALRDLGSDYDASSIIDVKKRILVLCSYSFNHCSNWQYVKRKVKTVLWNKKRYKPEIERIIDYGTSQLIWQSLFEQIRRTTGCVVDWSEYNASVFLELGVRLAVSEWGAVHIIDRQCLTGGEKTPEHKLVQTDDIHRLFNPITYECHDNSSAPFEEVVEALVERDPHLDGDVGYNRIHRVLLDVIGKVKEASLPLAEDLKRRADALHNTQQGKVATPQILFSGSRVNKTDSERAALELRIAAWLYLEYRVKAQTTQNDVDIYHDLGRSVKDALYDLGDNNSVQLALYIEDQLNKLE